MGGDGVGDQAQLGFAVLECGGDLVVGLDGGLQFGVGLGERGGALADMAFEFGLVAVDLFALALGLGDVRVQRDETLVGQGEALDLQQGAVGPLAAGVMRGETLRRRHALGHLGLDVARAILAAFGVVADEGLEGRARHAERVGKVEQGQEAAVAGYQAQVLVEDGDALVDVVQAGRNHLAIAGVADLLGRVEKRCHGSGAGGEQRVDSSPCLAEMKSRQD